MREAAVAMEKKAVERAIRPPSAPGAGSAPGSSPGLKASAARTAASAAVSGSSRRSSAATSGSSRPGVLGVSKLVSVAIVGGRLEPAPTPAQALANGQHSLTEEADPTQR